VWSIRGGCCAAGSNDKRIDHKTSIFVGGDLWYNRVTRFAIGDKTDVRWFSFNRTRRTWIRLLQMRATNARVPGRVANIIREYEHGTEREDGSITLSSLLAHHENQQERMQLRRDYGSSQPSTLDTLLRRMRRTRTIS